MEFCKAFNAQARRTRRGLIIPAEITIYRGPHLYLRVLKSPPAAVLLKKAAKIKKRLG